MQVAPNKQVQSELFGKHLVSSVGKGLATTILMQRQSDLYLLRYVFETGDFLLKLEIGNSSLKYF